MRFSCFSILHPSTGKIGFLKPILVFCVWTMGFVNPAAAQHNTFVSDTLEFDFPSFYHSSSGKTEWIAAINLNKFGVFNLLLRPSELHLPNASFHFGNKRIRIPGPFEQNIHHWQGNVTGTLQTTRLNVYPGKLSGFIETGNGMVYLETIEISGKTKLVAYTGMHPQLPEGLICNSEKIPDLHKKEQPPAGFVNTNPFSCALIKLSAVASWGLFKKNRRDTLATFLEIQDIIHVADGVYAKYIGVRLVIVSQWIATDSLQPYNTGGSTKIRLQDFVDQKNTFKSGISPDIYHLFTENYNDPDNSGGRGFIGTVCDNFNASTSMEFGGLNARAMILSHELGHNMNAYHGHGSDCGGPNASIMCPTGINTLVFNFTEQNVIKNYLKTISGQPDSYCLTYPVEYRFRDLCDKDTDTLHVQVPERFTFNLYLEQKWLTRSDSGIAFPVKQPGTYTLDYMSDTLNGVFCSMQKKIFLASREFKVTQNGEDGLGSLKYAILNANTCKGKDTITFELGEKINTLQLTRILPPIIEDCIIDGTSQNSYEYPDSQKVYRPAVKLLNKMPPGVYSKHALLLGRKNYVIRGIEFSGFEDAITNQIISFNKSEYSHLTPEYYGNAFMETEITGCKFIGNGKGIYFSMDDTARNNDRILIGDGSLHHANFFMGHRTQGLRIAFSDNAIINGNYFGAEPLIDTLTSAHNAITLNRCRKSFITNNVICNTASEGIHLMGSEVQVQNNRFGINPFNGFITGFTGSGVLCAGSEEKGCIVQIGGTTGSQQNDFYLQKNGVNTNGAVLQRYWPGQVLFLRNRSYAPDTSSILSSSSSDLPLVRLDSVQYSCTSGMVHIAGACKSGYGIDSLLLHFYGIPAGIKEGYQPIHDYLGMEKTGTKDTFWHTFQINFPAPAQNNGIVFTASSLITNRTSVLSNPKYPAAKQVKVCNLRDTTVCSGTVLHVLFNKDLGDYQYNGKPVNNPMTLIKPGIHHFSARDSDGCRQLTSVHVSHFPNFLKSAYILCNTYYSFDSVYKVYLADYYDSRKWNQFEWSAINGFVDNDKKLQTISTFNKETGIIRYQATDIHQCQQLITKQVFHIAGVSQPSRSIFRVYPNPGQNGIFKVQTFTPVRVRVYNTLGSEILSMAMDAGLNEMNLLLFPKGIYYLKAEGYPSVRLLHY